MTRALIACSLLATASAASAQTLPTQSRVEIVGEALPACLIRGGGNAQGSNVSFQSSGPFAGEIRIDQLIDPTTAVARKANVNLQLPVVCNGPHKVVLRSARGGLVRDGASGATTGPFRERLPYELSAVWNGRVLRQASDAAGPFVVESSDGRADDLGLSISLPGGGAPLVAGSYSDTITVEFQAAN